MGDRAQQVCPQLFIFCLHCCLLFFQRISAVFDGQRTFTQNGKQHTVFKGIQRFFGQIDPDHSKYAASGPKCKIKSLCIRVAIRACTGTLFVGKRPVCCIPFFRCRKDVLRRFPVNSKNLFCPKTSVLFQVDDQTPVQQLHQLGCRQRKDFFFTFGFL